MRMQKIQKTTRYRLGVPEEELSEEEKERYQKAVELYEYRRNRISTQLTVKEIFDFIEEWDKARMKIKNAGGW
ncbi:MAG: hypothetical protein HFJ09_08575 [Lachnospiraceae bacterium]|nr:hypothetical protein [Lachnospiraceae bacterium]